jgi:hypothetical protein
MDFKIILGIIAALLATISSIVYIRDIFRGNTKPHIYTWLVWLISGTLVFFGQVTAGGGPGSWATGVSAVFTLYIFILAFRYGTKDITRFDKICLALCLVSVIPWLITKNPVLSVVLATFTDVIGFLPTMRKTWHAPRSESLGSMFYDAVKHGLSFASLQTYSVTTYLFPLAVLITKLGIIGEIVFRRSVVDKPTIRI